MKEINQKKGFTIAEILITLTILGIVAAITVPQVARRQIEASNRAKLKKIMSVYDFLMNKMITENDLKSNPAIEEWADDNCQNTSNYFKIVKRAEEPKDGKDFCRFRTADGVWWDIEDITHPKISLSKNENDLDNLNLKTTFQLLGHFGPNGELRINDIQWETTSNNNLTDEEETNLKKIYDYINTNKRTNNTTILAKGEPFREAWKSYSINCYKTTEFKSCTKPIVANNAGGFQMLGYVVYDEKGKIIADGAFCDFQRNCYQTSNAISDGNGGYMEILDSSLKKTSEYSEWLAKNQDKAYYDNEEYSSRTSTDYLKNIDDASKVYFGATHNFTINENLINWE